MKTLTILHKGQKFESAGGTRFAKDVARVGEWIHPATGQIVNFDDARLRRLAEGTNRYLAAENKVPYPDGHRLNAMSNLGEWPGPWFVQGDRLWGVVDAKDPKAAENMRNGVTNAVSACIEFGIKDSKGNTYDEVITHVCATDYPVVTGQKEFIELSARPGWDELYLSTAEEAGIHFRRSQMDFAKLAAVLGLAKDTAPEKVLEEAEKKLGSAPADAKAQLSALEKQLAEQLSQHGLKIEGGKVEKLERKAESPEVKELREKIASMELDGHKAKISAAKVQAEALVKSGQVPPAVQQRLERVLAIAGKTEALVLSGDAKQVEKVGVDLAAELSALFAAIPSLSKDRLQQLAVEGGQETTKEAERLSKLGEEVAKRLQPATK